MIQENVQSENESIEIESPKPKRKLRNPSNWKRNITMLAKNKGGMYINASGKIVGPKILKPPCKDSCRFKCFNNVSLEEREIIKTKFWALGDNQGDNSLQREYKLRHTSSIVELSSIVTPKYELKTPGSIRKHNNVAYYLENAVPT